MWFWFLLNSAVITNLVTAVYAVSMTIGVASAAGGVYALIFVRVFYSRTPDSLDNA